MLEYTELNDSQRARILAAIASSYFHANECYTQQNLDLVTALSDGEMLLTMHYYVPPIVTQGDPEYGYLILRGGEVRLCTPETADAAARALIVPRCAVTIEEAIDSPRPKPPFSPERDLSPR